MRFKTFKMPKGESEDWDVIEEAMAHRLAREFAYEFIVDEDHASAMQRIGCDEPTEVCDKLGKTLHKHPIVTEYIREALNCVCKQVKIDPDNILAMLMREATDKTFGSSQRGRIGALKEVREWWHLLNPIGSAPQEDNGEDNSGANECMPALRIVIQDGTEETKVA